MKARDVVIDEYLQLKEPSKRYGYLKAVGIILANKNHSIDWKYTGQKMVPYITVVCEHRAFAKNDGTMILRRIRPRELMKEVKCSNTH